MVVHHVPVCEDVVGVLPVEVRWGDEVSQLRCPSLSVHSVGVTRVIVGVTDPRPFPSVLGDRLV